MFYNFSRYCSRTLSSYTNNEGILSGTATSGVARSNIVYSTDAIGDIGQVRALTFGTNGDSVASYINEGQGDATLFFLPGQVSLLANATYWDFSLSGNPALIQVSALVIDFYGKFYTIPFLKINFFYSCNVLKTEFIFLIACFK